MSHPNPNPNSSEFKGNSQAPRLSVRGLASKFEQSTQLGNGTTGQQQQHANPNGIQANPIKAVFPPSKPPKPISLQTTTTTHNRRVTITTPPTHTIKSTLQIPSSTIGHSGLGVNNILSKSTPNLASYDLQNHSDRPLTTTTASAPSAPKTADENTVMQVKNEIFSTEVSYYCDLLVLTDLYATPLRSGLLSDADWVLLFGGLKGVVFVSAALIYAMVYNVGFEEACNSVGEDTRWSQESAFAFHPDLDFGILFLDALGSSSLRMEIAYSKYCKNNEAALLKVAEYTSNPETYPTLTQFLTQTRSEMMGKTTSWDLSSLLVKPFQRILKYPLLLKRLDHPAQDVAAATARRINEVKKRRDVVEKYVSGSKNVNVMHGIHKKWTRSTQIIKNVATATRQVFEMQTKFDQMHALIPVLEKGVGGWCKWTRVFVESHSRICGALEVVYAEAGARQRAAKGGDLYEDVREYRRIWEAIHTLVKESEGECGRVCVVLAKISEAFKAPAAILKKRGDKKLDADRVEAMKGRGEEVEKRDLESAEEFRDLDAQLHEELPPFFGLVEEAVFECAAEINRIQSRFYGQVRERISEVSRRYCVGETSARGDYVAAMGRDAYLAAQQIGVLAKWTETTWSREGVWGGGAAGEGGPKRVVDIGEDLLVDLDTSVDASVSYDTTGMTLLVPAPSSLFSVKCLFHFEAEMEEEVTIHPDELLIVDGGIERSGSSEWWYGHVQNSNRKGWFPCNFVERI